MAYQSEVAFACNGSLALKAERAPMLRVIEGSKGATVEAQVRQVALTPTTQALRQTSPAADSGPHGTAHRLSGRSLRLSTMLAVACVTVVLGCWAAADAVRTGFVSGVLSSCETQSVEVSAGDSLWSIAEEHAVEGVSTRDVVSWISEQNHLASASISTGQTLVVPARN